MNSSRAQDLHEVVLEEVLQLSLSGRVREIPNVKSPPWNQVSSWYQPRR
jgi:hypothetical protein